MMHRISASAARNTLRRCLSTAVAEDGIAKEAANVQTLVKLSNRLAKGRTLAQPLVRNRGQQSFWAEKALAVKTNSEAVSESEGVSRPALPDTKSIPDSFISFDLPFESDPALHEVYVGGGTSIRIGRLFEDLDTLAGAVAYRHVLPEGCTPRDASKFGLYLVTASVDRLDMLRPLSAIEPEDLRLSGHISFAGRSSMEIFVKLESISRRRGLQDAPEPVLLGRFTMACRHSKTAKAKPIPQLIIQNEEDKAIQELGKRQKERKQLTAQTSLDTHQPSIEESAILHRLFMGKRAALYEKTAPKPDNMLWISETGITSALLMHPQERNIHGKVFGGYLMRLAYETAFTSAALFARDRVTFMALDELTFRLPVEIGSLLKMESKIAFVPTEGTHHSFQVSVQASTVELLTGKEVITNIFHFTFASEKPLQRYVLPKTYQEGISWLSAMRRRSAGQELRQLYHS